MLDDDRLVLATVVHGLVQAGYDVIDADNGDDAILLAREHRPELALLDIRMEGKTGFDVAEYLRDVCRIPFMFLSAFSDEATAAKVQALGAVAYLVKPLDVGKIVPTVDAALQRLRSGQAVGAGAGSASRTTLGVRSSTRATTSSPCCSSVSVAVRRGSSARARPRPDRPPGKRARSKPAGNRPRLTMVITTMSPDAAAPPPGRSDPGARVAGATSVSQRRLSPAPCLIALVSSSFNVNAIGIDSASGISHCDASGEVKTWMLRPKVRCTDPAIACSTWATRKGPPDPTCKP